MTRVPVRGRERDVAAGDALGPAAGGAEVEAAQDRASTTRISSSAKAAPMQRRTPPPNGIQV